MKQKIKVSTKYRMERHFEADGLRKTTITCPSCEREQVIENRRNIPVNLKTFICPCCGCKSDTLDKEEYILVESCKKKVLIRCEVKGMANILALPYLPEADLNIEFPYYEQIEFNFGNGHVGIRGITEKGRILHSADVTEYPLVLNGTELANWFYKSFTLRKSISESFKDAAKIMMPYEMQELALEDLVYLTRFVGYDRMFYSAIPYDKETLILDKSFTCRRQLHTKENAMKYLSSFSFAGYKSLKRKVCETSGLLFYLPECEALFHSVKDINVVKNIFGSPYAFELLLYLHSCPVTLRFLEDYCEKKGAVALYNILCTERITFASLKRYMPYYCSLNEYGKQQEQKKWRSKQIWFEREWKLTCSLPAVKKDTRDFTDTINGFSFKVLHNTAEYLRVGTELNNCLKTWEPGESVILSVLFAANIVAAIEVAGKIIVQAYGYGNQSIDNVAGLSEAIHVWAEKNGLEFEDEEEWE